MVTASGLPPLIIVIALVIGVSFFFFALHLVGSLFGLDTAVSTDFIQCDEDNSFSDSMLDDYHRTTELNETSGIR